MLNGLSLYKIRFIISLFTGTKKQFVLLSQTWFLILKRNRTKICLKRNIISVFICVNGNKKFLIDPVFKRTTSLSGLNILFENEEFWHVIKLCISHQASTVLSRLISVTLLRNEFPDKIGGFGYRIVLSSLLLFCQCFVRKGVWEAYTG